ncbi:MAG: hypothetical protein PVG98_09715 [Chromatiales bacterium]
MMQAGRVFGPPELLNLWERAQGLPLHRQALEMLAAAEPGQTPEALAALPVGERDARLLDLREGLFGPRLSGLVDCPGCGERVEIGFLVDDIRAAAGASGGGETEAGVREMTEGEWRVRYRLPAGADLAEVSGPDGLDDPDAARGRLLRLCVLSVTHGCGDSAEADSATAASGGPDRLPEEVAARLVEQMSEADPQADVELAMSCPACGQEWLAPFDIVSYLAAELDAWAERILSDVARLARGYGWREADILAMGPRRCRAYLELLEGL